MDKQLSLPKTILIAAGGTGGHIFPGLAIAEKLIASGYKIVWVGTVNGLEATLVPKNNIQIHYIKITGVRGKKLLTKILAPFNILFAVWQAIKIIKLLNPSTILGMGGFVSGPVGIAAWLLGKRLVIHEQNSIVGSSNRILAFFANKVLESFPNSFANGYLNKYINKNKIILTGLPVRPNLLGTLVPPRINDNPLKILVIGGSRGAQFLNQTIPKALGGLPNIKILHQTGEKEFLITKELYAQNSNQNIHDIRPFIDNMLDVYLWADLVICRAGASTVFEIMAVGVAAILVPLPWAIDDHQNQNALYLVNNNAGILLKQSEINASIEKLTNLIIDLAANKHKLYTMQAAARQLYKPYEANNSAEYITTVISSEN